MRALFAKTDDTNMMRRLDARTKLAVTLTTAILAVACSGVVAQGVLFLATLVYVLLLKRPGLLAVLYGAMAVMMAVAAGCSAVIEAFAPGLGGLSVKSLVIPFLRGLSMMNVVMVLAMTTRVEDLLTTLERMRLPFCLFLPAAVMLRFIPTFTHDIRQVWETLKIRGWPMGVGMLTRHPILSSRLLLAPILFQGPRHGRAHAHARPSDDDDARRQDSLGARFDDRGGRDGRSPLCRSLHDEHLHALTMIAFEEVS